MNMEVLGSEAPLSKLAKIINRLTIGIIIAGLFIGSSMLSLSSMEPRLLGVPVLAFFGYLGAAVLSVWVSSTSASASCSAGGASLFPVQTSATNNCGKFQLK